MTENRWVKKAKRLIIKSVKQRDKLTQSELEELRHEIAATRAMMVTEVLDLVTNDKINKELYMDSLEESEFVRFFEEYCNRINEKTNKKYNASMAESCARKAMKAKGTPYYKAKEEFLKAKSEESSIYQLLKSMDGVCNAMSAISK